MQTFLKQADSRYALPGPHCKAFAGNIQMFVEVFILVRRENRYIVQSQFFYYEPVEYIILPEPAGA